MPTKQTNDDEHPGPADHGHQSALLQGGLRFRSLPLRKPLVSPFVFEVCTLASLTTLANQPPANSTTPNLRQFTRSSPTAS